MSFKRNAADRRTPVSMIEFLESRRLLAADVTVNYSGFDIPDNDTTPSVAEGTDFGTVFLGSAARVREYTITNTGDEILTLGTISATGSFEVVNPAAMTSLPAGASTSFSIRLLTQTSGEQTGEISFSTNVSDKNPFNFKVIGLVADTASGPAIDVRFNDVPIDDGDMNPTVVKGTNFGAVEQGASAVNRFYSITNIGADDLILESFQVLGEGFTIVSAPGSVLLTAGTTYSLNVRMPTTETGLKNAAIIFGTNVEGFEIFNFAVRGIVNPQGVTPVEVRFGNNLVANGDDTPSTIEGTLFDTAPLNGTPTERVFTVVNTGNAPMSVLSAQVAGPFTIVQRPTGAIAPGQSGTLRVRLNTDTEGSFSQIVTLTTNLDSVPIYYFTVSGVVEPEQAPGTVRVTYNNQDVRDNDLTPSTTDGTDYGTVALNTELVRTFTIRNNGNTTLNLNNFRIVGTGFTIINTPATSLAPGLTTTVRVRLTTSTVGIKEAQLAFDTNVPAQNPYNFAIKGEVTDTSGPIAPPIFRANIGSQPLESGDSLNVGTTLLNGPWPVQTIRISNDGGGALTLRNIRVGPGFVYFGSDLVSVPAGQTVTLDFYMETDVAGPQQTTVSFATNDAGVGTFNFDLTGLVRATVIPGDLVVRYLDQAIADGNQQPTLFNGTDFGSSVQGQQGATRGYTLTNPGPGTLTVRSITLPNGFFHVGGVPTTIASGQSFVVLVRTNTTTPGNFSGDIVINTDEPNNPSYNFAITGSVAGDSSTPQPTTPDYILRGTGDFDGNGSQDLVWQDMSTGATEVWLMNANQRQIIRNLPATGDSNWRLEAIGDLSADGKPDLVYRHATTGQVVVWVMNGTAVQDMKVVALVANTSWQLAGAADFNNDGRADLVWRNIADGRNSLWLLSGLNSVGQFRGLPSTQQTSWNIGGVADFNNDGKPDIAWRNSVTGANMLWLMDGSSLLRMHSLPTVTDVNFRIGGAADINRDGSPDLLWQNRLTGQHLAFVVNNLSVTTTIPLPRFIA